jgi:hypothetical protein
VGNWKLKLQSRNSFGPGIKEQLPEMSRFTVNLEEPQNEQISAAAAAAGAPPSEEGPTIFAGQIAADQKPSAFVKFLKRLGIFLGAVLLVAGIGGFIYWQTVKRTPQYSLALLVDAARRDEKAQIEQLVDADAVVDNFMPQITAKAIELYGRNLPPQTLAKVERVAAPAIPIIKERAKTELPRVIREKTAPVEKAPYWLIALFADRAVDVTTVGDEALIKSKIPDRPLELTMQRSGDRWKVIGMKDDVLARRIAERIGQDIMATAARSGIQKAVEQLGVKNLDILKNAEDIFK